MKYWVFDGRDAQGPYEAEELSNLPLFGPETMICPEGTQSPDQWRPAKFYLVRPPGRPPAEPPRPQPRPRPAATTVEEPVVGTALAAAPKAAATPAPTGFQFHKLNVPPTAAAAAGMLLVAVFGWWLARPTPGAKTTPKDAADGALPRAEAVHDAQAEAAVSLLKSYPMAGNKQRLPAAAGEALSPARWTPAVNLGDYYERRALLALSQDAQLTVTRQGRTRAAGEKEIARDPARWERYSRKFLERHFFQSWSAESFGGGRYIVTVRLRYQEGGPEHKRRFEVSPAGRTLRPLDLDAWFDIDPKAAQAWSSRNLYLGSLVDENAITLRAPEYMWDTLKTTAVSAASKTPAAKPPEGAAAAMRRTTAPPADEDEYESVSPEEVERAIKRGRPSAAAAGAAKAKPAADIPQMSLPSDAELGAAPRPAAAKPAVAPSQPSEPLELPSQENTPVGQRESAQDATKMNVDELERYLSRGKKPDAAPESAKPKGEDLWDQ